MRRLAHGSFDSSPVSTLIASIASGAPLGGGGVSIVTQSGSYGMAVHTLGQDEALRVAKVYAAGNKADVTDAELLAYLRDDPATTVICLLLESITDARRFFLEACQTTPVKPVVAGVGGRTGAGQRAALSHTAALATDARRSHRTPARQIRSMARVAVMSVNGSPDASMKSAR